MDRSALRWDAEVDGVCALPIRVVRPVRWERLPAQRAVRIHMDRAGRATTYRDTYAPLLEGIDAGDDLPGLVARLVAAEAASSRSAAVRMALSFVHGLAAEGNVEVVLPPVPPVLASRFEVVRELGRGGVGVAWLCRDRDRPDGPRVVVKHAWNFAGDLKKRDRAIRDEAALLARLAHPRIAGVVATFEVDGRFHLVREFVDGEELYARVVREGAPSPVARRATARAFAALLAHVHARGLLWMDANPSNLLVPRGADAEAFVVADVGHCKPMVDGAVRFEEEVGRYSFAAPEVRAGKPATPRTDVFGLGFFYAFLVTERKPSPRATAEKVLAAAGERGADEGEVAFLEACLAEDPRARPAGPEAAVALL